MRSSAALLLLTMGADCAPTPAPGQVEGRRWTHASSGLQVDFPQGWVIATDPANFRSGLPAVALEGSVDSLRVALSVYPMPGLGALGQSSAMDRLTWLSPGVGAGQDPGYRLQRLPDCDGSMERRHTGLDGRAFQQVAVATPSGLALFSAWDPDSELNLEPLRALACAHTRVAP